MFLFDQFLLRYVDCVQFRLKNLNLSRFLVSGSDRTFPILHSFPGSSVSDRVLFIFEGSVLISDHLVFVLIFLIGSSSALPTCAGFAEFRIKRL